MRLGGAGRRRGRPGRSGVGRAAPSAAAGSPRPPGRRPALDGDGQLGGGLAGVGTAGADRGRPGRPSAASRRRPIGGGGGPRRERSTDQVVAERQADHRGRGQDQDHADRPELAPQAPRRSGRRRSRRRRPAASPAGPGRTLLQGRRRPRDQQGQRRAGGRPARRSAGAGGRGRRRSARPSRTRSAAQPKAVNSRWARPAPTGPQGLCRASPRLRRPGGAAGGVGRVVADQARAPGRGRRRAGPGPVPLRDSR